MPDFTQKKKDFLQKKKKKKNRSYTMQSTAHRYKKKTAKHDRCEQRKGKKIPDNIDQNEWNEEEEETHTANTLTLTTAAILIKLISH